MALIQFDTVSTLAAAAGVTFAAVRFTTARATAVKACTL